MTWTVHPKKKISWMRLYINFPRLFLAVTMTLRLMGYVFLVVVFYWLLGWWHSHG